MNLLVILKDEIKFICTFSVITFQNFCSDCRFCLAQIRNGKFELLHQRQHSFKLFFPLDENFHRLFNIVGAVKNRLVNFFGGQLAINIERNFRFPNVRPHEGFKGFQTNRGIWHHIKVVQGNTSEGAAELPPLLFLHDDIIIDSFRVKAAQNPFQNVLVITTTIEPRPNVVDMGFIQLLQGFRVIDDDVFFLLCRVHHDHQPIKLEHLKIVKQHFITSNSAFHSLPGCKMSGQSQSQMRNGLDCALLSTWYQNHSTGQSPRHRGL